MVFGHALCAVNLASAVLANGMCCFYEMRREEERRKEQHSTIRQSVHSEWERQRYLDMVERQTIEDQTACQLQEERRIRSMASKQAPLIASGSTVSNRSDNDVRERPRFSHQQKNYSSVQSGSDNGGFARPTLVFKTPKNVLFKDPRECSSDYPTRRIASLMDEYDDDFEEVFIE